MALTSGSPWYILLPEVGRMPPTVEIGPAVVDGRVSRVVSDGVTTWAETWGPSGWTRGGTTIGSVAGAPPASPETLAALGIPYEASASAAPTPGS